MVTGNRDPAETRSSFVGGSLKRSCLPLGCDLLAPYDVVSLITYDDPDE